MNNLEALLADHGSVLYNALDCDCCAYYHDGEPCIYEFRMCEQGYREWLLADVYDESCNQVADQCEHTETPPASKWKANDAQDSREKLEADVRNFVRSLPTMAEVRRYGEVINLLDRQSEIAQDETIHTYNLAAREARKVQEERIAELTEQVSMLTEFRDRWRSNWTERNAEYDELLDEYDKLKAERDEWKTKCETREFAYKQADAERKRYSEQIDELQAERDEWKRKAEEEKSDAKRYWENANNIAKERDECKEHTDELLAKLIAERGEWKAKYESLLCVQESSRLHENDSREKLEADMRERLGELWADAWDAGNRDSMDDNFDLSVFIALLDRQAAIIEREIEKKWSCFSDSADGHIAKLQKQVDELTAERDYWKSEVEWCMHAAYPPSHAPEPPYNPNVMAYPDRHGCTTPSTLVSAIIDGLREEKAPEYMGLLDEIVKLEDERDGLQDQVAALEKELKIARGNLKVTLNNWEQAKGKIRRQTEELAERRRKLDERDQKTVEEIRDDRADYWKSRAEKAEKEREEWRSKCGKLMGLANEMMSA